MLSRKNLDLLSAQFAVWGEGSVGEGTFFFPLWVEQTALQ